MKTHFRLLSHFLRIFGSGKDALPSDHPQDLDPSSTTKDAGSGPASRLRISEWPQQPAVPKAPFNHALFPQMNRSPLKSGGQKSTSGYGYQTKDHS